MSPGAPACGDGIVSGTETCDDANETAVDGCAACKSGCALGWKPYLNRCYRLTPNTHKYGEVYDGPGAPNENRSLARAAWDREPCAKLGVGGAHLAMIESLAEGNAVAKLLAGNFLGSAPWVAAGAPWRTDVDTKMPAFWRQSEGGFVPPALWTSNAPRSNERCAVLAADGKLDSTACFGETPKDPYPERRALCESEPVCRLGKKGSGGADGYVAPNGHCYAMIPGVKDTHVDAAARCEALGAHLATFEDAEELGDLPGADLTSDEVWVGATRQACANDAFVWTTSGQPVPTTPIFWSGSEPNGPQERCAAMLRERRLADFSCDAKYQVLCERDY